MASTSQSIYNSVNGSSLTSPPSYRMPTQGMGDAPYTGADVKSYLANGTVSPGTQVAESGTAPVSTGATGTGSSPAPTYGTESGPGILGQWFNERATGTDPGYEYATGRGLTALNNQYAARGGYNSGAALQGDSDYLANMGSQREGQLDTLASGASGERQNSLATMLGLGMGITGGEAGLASNYDLGAANALNTGNAAALQLGTNAALAPYQAKQGLMNNLFGLGAIGLMG